MTLSGEKALLKECCVYLEGVKIKGIKLFFYAIPAVRFTKGQGGFPIGYKKSMPDLCIPRWKLYIETKDPKTKHPAEHLEKQRKRHDELRAEGCNVYVIENIETFRLLINLFLQGKQQGG